MSAPMDPERLDALRKRIEPCVDGTATHFPVFGWSEVAPLLAEHDRLAAEVKILESMLAAAVQPRIVISGSCLECGYEGDMS